MDGVRENFTAYYSGHLIFDVNTPLLMKMFIEWSLFSPVPEGSPDIDNP